MPLKFRKGCTELIKDCVRKVYWSYKELHGKRIIVRRRHVRASTMQAQPVVTLRAVLLGFRTYKLTIAYYVRDSDNIEVDDLEKDVLTGWIAHEFGHLMDYNRRSALEMAIFGLRYLLFRAFARRVEHRADVIAVKHGFYPQVRETKKFLSGTRISKNYRRKLRDIYMSVDDLELCNIEWQGRVPTN
jgi:hypothetical protein